MTYGHGVTSTRMWERGVSFQPRELVGPRRKVLMATFVAALVAAISLRFAVGSWAAAIGAFFALGAPGWGYANWR